MKERCEREVTELHRFFQDWFGGLLENDADTLSRFGSVLAEGFLIVPPGGSALERGSLVERLTRSARELGDGSRETRAHLDREFSRASQCRRLGARDLRGMAGGGWRNTGPNQHGRFGRREDTPNGVEWLHVHETWLPDSQS